MCDPKASFRGDAKETHRATTLLDEPPLKHHDEIDRHTRPGVDPDAEAFRRKAREMDCRCWDCQQGDLSQLRNTDVLGDRAIFGGNIDCGAFAARRTTLRTLLAAVAIVRAATAGLSTFRF